MSTDNQTSAVAGEVGKMSWKALDAAQWEFFDRFTAVTAREMIKRSGILDLPQDTPLSVLDNACGTGIVTKTLYESEEFAGRENVEVLCTDISEKMVASVNQHAAKQGWKTVRGQVANALDSKLPKEEFTHTFTNVGPASLAETLRVLKPGGQLNFTWYHQVGWITFADKAWVRIPDAPPLPNFAQLLFRSQGPWDNPEYIRAQILATKAVRPESVKVELFPCEGVADNARVLAQQLVLPITHALASWPEEKRDEVVAKLVPELEAVFVEKFGSGPCKFDDVGIVSSAIKV